MQKDFTPADIIELMKRTKKTDRLFKPLKKLKTALESMGMENVSLQARQRVVVFHFGLGNQLDKSFIELTKPTNLCKKIQIIPGRSYCFLQFQSNKDAAQYLSNRCQMHEKTVFYQELEYQNLKRILVFLYCKDHYQREQEATALSDCSSKYYDGCIPGLILVDDAFTKQEELYMLQNIDKGNWERLNNRRVQHHGYIFKYGRNQIDKEEQEGVIPEYFKPLLKKLQNIPILKDKHFDQLTINDYFAGNGIPSHFDTHSPFQEVFISVSMLSGIVMDFRKFNGEEKSVFLRERSVAVFSGQIRYAWTHGIACRKIDRLDNQLVSRSRRVSLTFRKIKFTPCICPYYFYCDSQGYDQQTMKKNNPLLTKYMNQQHSQTLKDLNPSQIQKQFVEKAYNGFGFDFHNKVIEQIRLMIQVEIKFGETVLDLGCGNGEYEKYMPEGVFYIGVQKCISMAKVSNGIFMDCMKLAFRDRTFDRVILVAVLHHFASEEARLAVLRDCWRVMREGGVLYLSVLSFQLKKQIYNHPQTLLQYCLPANKIEIRDKFLTNSQQMQTPRIQQRGQVYKRYYHLFEMQQLKDLLKKAAFEFKQLAIKGQNIICKAIKA